MVLLFWALNMDASKELPGKAYATDGQHCGGLLAMWLAHEGTKSFKAPRGSTIPNT